MNAPLCSPRRPPSVHAPWSAWRHHFEQNASRPLPSPGDLREVLPPETCRLLLPALARFQVGECGEGRIAREIFRADLPEIDDDYRAALGAFIREEGRHARILAAHIKTSRGTLLHDSWTRRVFSVGRRVAGVRTELVALMAAEIVGIAFYAEVGRHLPPCPLRDALVQIATDEQAHLDFHAAFFARQLRAEPRWRPVFIGLWMSAITAGATLMVLDNREVLRALGIDPAGMWRWQMRRARSVTRQIDLVRAQVPST